MATFYYGGSGTDPLIRIEVYETSVAGTFTVAVTQVQATDADAFLDPGAKYYLGDLRAFYLDFANTESFKIQDYKSYSSYDATGTVISSTPTSSLISAEGVTSVGSKDTNMNGSDGGSFDAGIEIGTQGIGKDDVGSITFTVVGPTLEFSDFLNASFGIRITSVGLDANKDGDVSDKGETRTDSSKISYETPGAPDPAVVTISSANATESSDLIFSVSLSNASALPIKLAFVATAGTASAGEFETSNFEYRFDSNEPWQLAGAGNVIEIPAGKVALQIRLNTGDDIYLEGPETMTLGASLVSGSVASITSGTGTIKDSIDTTIVTLDDVTVDEGTGTATIKATVSNAVTGSDLVITLSNGATVTIPVGATFADSTAFAIQGEDPYVDGGSTTVSISGTTGGNFEDLDTSDTATVTVEDTIDTTTVTLDDVTVDEGDSATITATVNNAVEGSALVLLLSNGAQVTIAVGSTTGVSTNFTPTASSTVSIQSATGGTFEAINSSDTANVSVVPDETTISGLHFDPSAESGNNSKLGNFVADNPTGIVRYDALVTPLSGAVGSVDVNDAGDLVLGGSAQGKFTVSVSVYDADGNVIGDSFIYNLSIGTNQGETLSFTLTSDNNIAAAQGGSDRIEGSNGEDFLYGGSGNDTLIGLGGDDWLFGGGNNDSFVLAAPASNGTDIVADFTSGADKIGLRQNGDGWNASGSTGSITGAPLASADYVNKNDLSQLAGTNNKVVELQQSQTTSYMETTVGASVNAYVLVYNSETGSSEMWHDSNWSDTSGRNHVLTIENIDSLSELQLLGSSDFSEWI